MKFTDKEKALAKQESFEELDKLVPPKEIDERNFYHYCVNKPLYVILEFLLQEFDLKNVMLPNVGGILLAIEISSRVQKGLTFV